MLSLIFINSLDVVVVFIVGVVFQHNWSFGNKRLSLGDKLDYLIYIRTE